MKNLAILWVLFGLLFLSLAVFHFFQSAKEIKKFEITERPGKNTQEISVSGLDIDQPLKDFSDDFNNYTSEVNLSNKWMNIAAAIGYLLASATAFFSLYLNAVSK